MDSNTTHKHSIQLLDAVLEDETLYHCSVQNYDPYWESSHTFQLVVAGK